MPRRKGGYAAFLAVSIVLVAAAFLISLALGRYPVPPRDVLRILADPGGADLPRELALPHSVIVNIRLPRMNPLSYL